MTNTTRDLNEIVQGYDLPIDQSDAAHAANDALRAGKEIVASAREAWALVKETFGEARGPLEDGTAEAAARRIAVRLEQSAGKTLGLVSSSACGLWGVDTLGRIFQVDATNGGSDYLHFVRWVSIVNNVSGAVAFKGGDEIPVSSVAAFFDTYQACVDFRDPKPARTFLGRSLPLGERDLATSEEPKRGDLPGRFRF